MYVLRDILEMMSNVVKTGGLIDVFDIFLLTIAVFLVIKLVKETRAGQLIKGISFYSLLYLVCSHYDMRAMTYIMEKLFNVGLIALCIVFQPELRRALEKLGRANVTMFSLGESGSDEAVRWHVAINAIAEACEELSATTTGALIVIERQTKLGEQVETGTIISARPSREILCNIFYPKTPLHDGAVIVRDGMLYAAACFLPKPQKEELINKKLGSRHRAAIGMSENSDAIVVVVSEETGTISIADDGSLQRGFTKEDLKEYLRRKLFPEKAFDDILKRRKKNAPAGLSDDTKGGGSID